MNHFKTIGSLLFLAALTGAQAQSDAKAIFDKMLTAAKNVKSVKYTMDGAMATSSGKMKATVFIKKADVPTPGPLSGVYWVTGESDGGGKGKDTFAYSYDGKVFRYLDGGTTVDAIDSPTLAEVARLVPFEPALFPLNPFGFSEWRDGKFKYLRRETVSGFDCDIIQVTREVEGKFNDTLTFVTELGIDRKSHLPVLFKGDRGTLKRVLTLDINATANDSEFKLQRSEKKVKKEDILAKGLLPLGQAAPEFDVLDSNGERLSLSSFKGKLLLIDFWGTWCQPCINAMPELKALFDSHGSKGLSMVSMAVADEKGDPTGFMKSKGYNWTSVPRGESAAKAYQVSLFPSLYLIGKDGTVLFRVAGTHPDTKATLDDLIRRSI
jgi:thiol-disulfide isomerase/thioredoxin